MFKQPVKAALFDMDGLLIDSEAVYIAAMQAAARTLDREMPLDFCHRWSASRGPSAMS